MTTKETIIREAVTKFGKTMNGMKRYDVDLANKAERCAFDLGWECAVDYATDLFTSTFHKVYDAAQEETIEKCSDIVNDEFDELMLSFHPDDLGGKVQLTRKAILKNIMTLPNTN